MKCNLPKSWESLPQKEKQIITESIRLRKGQADDFPRQLEEDVPQEQNLQDRCRATTIPCREDRKNLQGRISTRFY